MNCHITNLVVKEIESSLSSQEMIRCLFLQSAFLSFLRQMRPGAILFRNEFQPYERAVLSAAKEEKIFTVGLQHALLGANHLPYQFGTGEIERYSSARESENVLPLPDYFLLSGDFAASIWKQNGFPRNGYGVCGPVRFPKIGKGGMRKEVESENLRQELMIPFGRKIIFVSLSIVWREVVNLLSLVLKAADTEVLNSCFFLFKNHPACHYDARVKDYLSRRAVSFPCRLLSVSHGAAEVMGLANALISSGSTVCMEAIAQEVIPVVFRDASLFSANPMIGFSEGVISVSTSSELNKMLKLIVRGESFRDLRLRWKDTLRAAFGDMGEEPSERFVRVLHSIL